MSPKVCRIVVARSFRAQVVWLLLMGASIAAALVGLLSHLGWSLTQLGHRQTDTDFDISFLLSKQERLAEWCWIGSALGFFLACLWHVLTTRTAVVSVQPASDFLAYPPPPPPVPSSVQMSALPPPPPDPT